MEASDANYEMGFIDGEEKAAYLVALADALAAEVKAFTLQGPLPYQFDMRKALEAYLNARRSV